MCEGEIINECQCSMLNYNLRGEEKQKNKNAVDTGVSRAVPHLSTNPASRRLTSEFGWDPVH